jgi:hypothetical protein
MATKRGKVSDRIAVVIGPEAEVSVIVGLGKRTTDRLARSEYARLHTRTPGRGLLAQSSIIASK